MFSGMRCQKHIFIDFLIKLLFIFRGEGREEERERNIDQLPLVRPQLACAWTGSQTVVLSFCRPVLDLLGHTSQGPKHIFK